MSILFKMLIASDRELLQSESILFYNELKLKCCVYDMSICRLGNEVEKQSIRALAYVLPTVVCLFSCCKLSRDYAGTSNIYVFVYALEFISTINLSYNK